MEDEVAGQQNKNKFNPPPPSLPPRTRATPPGGCSEPALLFLENARRCTAARPHTARQRRAVTPSSASLGLAAALAAGRTPGGSVPKS